MTKKAKARLDVRIPEPLKKKLVAAAENSGEDMTHIVTVAIKEELLKYNTWPDGVECDGK